MEIHILGLQEWKVTLLGVSSDKTDQLRPHLQNYALSRNDHPTKTRSGLGNLAYSTIAKVLGTQCYGRVNTGKAAIRDSLSA